MGIEEDKHPLERFRYCPVCGSHLFIVNDFKSKHCTNCGFEFYLNTAAAVVCILFDQNDKLLITKRAFEPQKGMLDLPGGFVDMNESLEDSVKREMMEETGIVVKPQQWLFSQPNKYIYSGMDIFTEDSFFLCSAESLDNLHPTDDVSEIFWVSLDNLYPEQFGLTSIRQALPQIVKLFKK